MPQETNLNTVPYFDDFDVNKDYYRVLFKPGYPIQARELTTLQSTLQNQIEQFGNHIFKEGSVVIPGNLKYQNPVYAVEVESTFNGLPISLYFSELLGKTVQGQNSGVVGEIFYILNNIDSIRGTHTLYVRFKSSGGQNFDRKTFDNAETLILVNDTVSYGNFVIQSGQGLCNTIASNSVSQGSFVSLDSGVYFVRGIFARVEAQNLLLDQYGTEPSYKVGFEIQENLITADDDQTLFDNAQGFSNYVAPGADRLQIKLILSKKSLTDTDTNNFVEIFRVNSGVPTYASTENPTYNIIRDELARRTFDESGDYIVNPFTVYVRDCLNDRYRTNGIYYSEQITAQNNAPSEDLMVYQVGPGKAYVNGYEVETISTRFLDVPKPRTTKKVENVSVNFSAGTLFVLDNTYGSAQVGLGTTAVVSLMSSRLGSNKVVAAGTTIGQARIYDYVPESSYENNTSRMHLRLFDIDTYTVVGLSTNITLTTPTHIKGKTSNATGFLKQSVTNSNSLTLYSVSGQFLENERIVINGIENNRLINSVTDYSLADVKSVYSKIGISTFNADTCLTNKISILSPGTTFNISTSVGGISTVSAGLNFNFINKIKAGDIISYQNSNTNLEPIYNVVNSVSSNGSSFTISGITTVSNICDGNLFSSAFSVNNIVKLTPEIFDANSGLITLLPDRNVSNIELETTTIFQRRMFKNVSFSNKTLSISVTEQNISFAGFDEDRYVITYSNGVVETIRSDKFSISLDGKTATFFDLSYTTGNADVIATVQNIKPNPKNKKLNKVSNIIVDKSIFTSSGIGTTTTNDGLTYSSVYGLRVQDEEISLNVPDVVRVLGIFESSNIGTPNIPRIQLSSFTGPNNSNIDYLLGEVINGKTSGAVGIIVDKIDSDKLEFCYLNGFQFVEGEVIVGDDTKIEAIISQTYIPDKNILNNFFFNNGQTHQIYDYGKIIRKKNVPIPKHKLKIVFQNYTIDSNDTGEFISVNSYSPENYKFNIPTIENISLSDFIDIRPRVKPYNSLTNRSPFEYDNRDLSFDGAYSNYNIIPDNNVVLSYDYYLGRIDKVLLNKDGTLEVVQGIPDKNPIPPDDKFNSMTLGMVYNSPYVYSPLDSNVIMQEYKRYRMSDISLLENRIKRLEDYTTLSIAEMKTESLVIKDAETGLDRFKCGFFVDNFTTNIAADTENSQFRCSISDSFCYPIVNQTFVPIQYGSSAIEGLTDIYSPTEELSYASDLGSSGVKKTGDLITLNYVELLYDEQEIATKSETITNSNSFWRGEMTLSPSEDNWYDDKSIEQTSFNTNFVRNTTPEKNIIITENITEDKVVWANPPRSNNNNFAPIINYEPRPPVRSTAVRQEQLTPIYVGTLNPGKAPSGSYYIPAPWVPLKYDSSQLRS